MIGMCADPFGEAIRDHHEGSRDAPLIDRDGSETREQAIQRWYFDSFDRDPWFESWLDGPMLDMGAGAGRDPLYFQENHDVVAIEISPHLVTVMRDRGVADARQADMFALRDHFDRDRFRSAIAVGTQVQLAGSMAALRDFLGELAYVTTPDATAILHGYAPELSRTADIFGYRSDPAPGLAHRVFHCFYAGDVGRTLYFRLFSLNRLAAATVGTPWELADSRYGPAGDATPVTWYAVLTKDNTDPMSMCSPHGTESVYDQGGNVIE